MINNVFVSEVYFRLDGGFTQRGVHPRMGGGQTRLFRDVRSGVFAHRMSGFPRPAGNATVTAGKHAKAWTPNSAARCPRFSVPP